MKISKIIAAFMKIVFFIPLLVMIYTCEAPSPVPPPSVQVYKFKSGTDYTKYVLVSLNRSKTRVTEFPNPGQEELSIIDNISYKGYYVGGSCTPNSAFLDILIEDYDSVYNTLSEYKFDAHILEKEPFEEFYYDIDGYLHNSCPECLEKDTTWLNIDTAKFRKLVDENTLSLFLEQVI